MEQDKSEIATTYTTRVCVAINKTKHDQDELFRLSNLYYLDDEECNYFDESKGKLVHKYPDKITEEFKNCNHSIHASQVVTLEITYSVVTGKILNIKWIKK